MGTYKVPQNVEAEDKILGPLSMKQFIYALIGIGYGMLTFVIFKQITLVLWVLIGVPPMLALVALGLYQREDQPLETFVVAMASFFTRPHARFWVKEPIANAFHLEPPPPKPEMAKRDPREVRSQLAQLADLVDTRGWAAKEPTLQEPEAVPVVDMQGRIGADSLLVAPVLSDPNELTAEDDILDSQNTASQNLGLLMENTVQNVREEAQEKMASTKKVGPQKAATSISSSTASPSGDIVKLAHEGGDLSVHQVAEQARRKNDNLNEGQTVSLRHA